MESTIHPALDADGPPAALPFNRWGIDFQDQHVHPKQTERIEVRSGELQVSVDGDERTLSAGEDVEIPQTTPHRHYTETAEPVRVVWQRSPALRTAEWAKSVSAQTGAVDEQGTPAGCNSRSSSTSIPKRVPTWPASRSGSSGPSFRCPRR